MTELILPLISLAIAAALQPAQVIAMIVFLSTPRGKLNGLAYLAGMTAFRLVLGGVSWVFFSSLEDLIESGGEDFSVLVGAILVVLGLLLLVYALRQVFSAPAADEMASSWLYKLETVSPGKSFLVGIAFLALDPKDWIIDISVVNLIAEADLIGIQSFFVYLAYILLAQSLLWMPLLLTRLDPERARSSLDKLNTWMKAHDRQIEISVAILFGLVFLAIGLEQLDVF